MAELLLGVNIDHVATLRNARGTAYLIPFRLRLLQNKRVLMASPFTCAKTAATSPIAMCACCVRLFRPA